MHSACEFTVIVLVLFLVLDIVIESVATVRNGAK